jgi:hypothetical protein
MYLDQYRERYPYGGASLRRMSASGAAREAARRQVSSVDAAAFAADLLEREMLRFENQLISDLGTLEGRDLSQVDLRHVFIDSPNAITLFESSDRSYAIGVDPGFWHAMLFLYWDAALGLRVNDPQWFLILATKTVSWFWVGTSQDWTGDVDATVKLLQDKAPDLWSLGRDFVNAAILFTIAHEVGHVVLGHVDGSHATSLRLTEDGQETRASAMDDKQLEFDADAWAAEALFRWAGSDFKKQTLVLTVPAVCFSLSALKDEMTVPASNAIAQATADSHPPDIERAQRLHELAGSHASAVPGSNAMKHFVELGLWVSEQRKLLQREGMHWVPDWFRDKGLV